MVTVPEPLVDKEKAVLEAFGYLSASELYREIIRSKYKFLLENDELPRKST